MSTSLILMIVCFLALMIIGLPIAYNLLITTVVYLLSADLNIVQLAIKMYGGMNSFSFLAVPFFVLTGQLMLRGGLLESLVKFVNVWFGNFKGRHRYRHHRCIAADGLDRRSGGRIGCVPRRFPHPHDEEGRLFAGVLGCGHVLGFCCSARSCRRAC